MKYKPHPYQQYAIDYIKSHPIAAILLDCGLGKTSITLTAIEDMIYDTFEVRKALVVAPIRVARLSWPDEIRKWDHLSDLRYSVVVGTRAERLAALQAKADIYIVNRENLPWLVEESGMPFDYDMCVLDELSSFKKCWIFPKSRVSRCQSRMNFCLRNSATAANSKPMKSTRIHGTG